MGEERGSIEPDADARDDEVEGHALTDGGSLDDEEAVEGHALVDGSE